MKNTFICLVLFSFSVNSYAQIVNIPDDNFKNALLENFYPIDTNNDGEIQVDEAEEATIILVSFDDISNATGIEAFTNIEVLDISGNNLTTVNLAQNTALIDLRISSNPLPDINLATNINLERLDISSAMLSNVDVSNAPLLKRLQVDNNPIEEIDLSSNLSLELFDATNTLISELNVTALLELKSIRLGGNNSLINELDLSNNSLLEVLRVRGTDLSGIDLQNNTNLIIVDVGFNEIESVDVSNNVNIEFLSIAGNPISELEVTSLNALKALNFNFTSLETINLSNNAILCSVTGNGCQNLISVNLQNGNNEAFAGDSCEVSAFAISGGFPNTARFSSSDNIEVICVDSIEFAQNNFIGVVATAEYQENCSLSTQEFMIPTVSVYPNPTQDIIYLSENIENVSLYDITGRQLLKSSKKILSLKELPNNVYILKIETSQGLLIRKILKN